jgi:hypothetical protein
MLLPDRATNTPGLGWGYSIKGDKMPRLIWLGETVFDADKIVAIRQGSKAGTILVWTVGQSAVDGNFLIEMDFEEAIKLWSGEVEEEIEVEEVAG